jgi:hypothetical protein
MSNENETPLHFAVTVDDDDEYFCDNFSIRCVLYPVILEHHIVKIKTANLYVSNENLRSVSNGDVMREFQNECEEEIARLKSEKVGNATVSFYDILTKGTNQLAMYARNDSIVQVLKSDDYKGNFPIYASMINCNFRKGERRKELLEQGNKFFHFPFNTFRRLPHDCTDRIFSYLIDEDLRILIDACNPVSIQQA